MGFTRLNSRIFTNSFAGKNNSAYAPFYFEQKGDSFYNLSRAQYSRQTYYQLANNGAGAGVRGDRWLRANGYQPTSFIPPNPTV
jgi:hypothetical protein